MRRLRARRYYFFELLIFPVNLGCAWWQKPGFYEYIGLVAVIVGRNPVSRFLREVIGGRARGHRPYN